MIGTNINEYFNAAMKYPIERLTAVMQGKDNSLPQAAAMMALQIKKPMIDAMKGKQAQAQPPQPSVKDQMEQDITMLPENIGIGQLPAPNMERMADGGITGYADGGMVAFAGGGLGQDRELYNSLIQQGFVDAYGNIRDTVKKALGLKPGWEKRFAELPLEDTGGMTPYASPTQSGVFSYEQPSKVIADASAKTAENAPVVENIAPVAEGYKGEGMAGLKPTVKKKTDTSDAATSKSKPSARTGDAGLGQLADRQAAVTGDTSLSGAYTMAKGMGAEEEAENQRALKGFETESIRALEDQRVAREAGRPTGKPYENLERSLSRETEAAAGKEEKNLKMAIINAGLAMMGGKSQYAMQNIAEGAQVGTKQYQAGIDKLETAAKDREKMNAMIEESRRAEARGDWKDKADYDQKVTEAKLGLKKNSIDAIVKLTGENKKNATEIWKQQSELVKSDKEMASRERIADKQVAGGITQAGIYAGARGASTDPYNVAYDNATSRLRAEVLADPMLKARMAADPDLAQRLFNQYLQEALNKKPGAGGGGGGPAAVTGKTTSGATTSGW